MRQRFWRVVGGQMLAVARHHRCWRSPSSACPWRSRSTSPGASSSRRSLFEDKRHPRGLPRQLRAGPRPLVAHRPRRRLPLRWSRIVVGPVLTFALIFTTLPLIWINLLGSLIFALLIPYVALGETLLYFDLQARAESEPSKPRAPAGSGGGRAPPLAAPEAGPAASPRAVRFGGVKLLAFSDLHRDLGQAAKLVEMSADADVVIGAGDFASVHEGLEETIDALAAIATPTRARPRQQRDRRRAARRRCRVLARRRRCCTARGRRSTASSSSASAPASRPRPGNGASTSPTTRPRRCWRPARRARRWSCTRRPRATATRRRRHPLRQPGAAGGDRAEAAAAGRLRPHPRVLGLRERGRRDAGPQPRPDRHLDRGLGRAVESASPKRAGLVLGDADPGRRRRQPQPGGRQRRPAGHRQGLRRRPDDAQPGRRRLLARPRRLGPLPRRRSATATGAR